jgi:cytochrome c5
MTLRHLSKNTVAVGMLFLLSVATAVAQSPEKQPEQKKTQATINKTHDDNPGQRVFDQNCSRCHNAPEGFSPHVSGTIARHMRVRAQLSEHDYQELLRFLNP